MELMANSRKLPIFILIIKRHNKVSTINNQTANGDKEEEKPN